MCQVSPPSSIFKPHHLFPRESEGLPGPAASSASITALTKLCGHCFVSHLPHQTGIPTGRGQTQACHRAGAR